MFGRCSSLPEWISLSWRKCALALARKLERIDSASS